MFKIQILPKEEQALRDRINKKLEEVYLLAERIYSRSFPRPTVVYDVAGRKAGQANYRQNVIDLNWAALKKYPEETINETLPHEIAHLITFQVYGARVVSRNHHGWEWRNVARNLGSNADRCHSMDLEPAKKTRKFLYTCGCSSKFKIGLNVHRKIEQNEQERFCRRCRGIIYFVKELFDGVNTEVEHKVQEPKDDVSPKKFKIHLRF